jgi:ribosomal protein L29
VHRCDDLRQMTIDQLENLAIDNAKEEFGYRFGSHDDAKAKAGLRSVLRRQIARIATIIAEKQRATVVSK